MQAPVSQLVRYPGPSATKTSKCADQPHQLVHHRPFRDAPRGPTLHSSQVKPSQVHPITTKESIQSQIREGQYLVFVHNSSRHTTRKQHLLTAEAFHLPARPVLREYSYRVLCSRHRCYATTISEYGIASRRPDPKHDRNPNPRTDQVRRDSSPLLHRHTRVRRPDRRRPTITLSPSRR